MATTITITTTDAEDAAILALTAEAADRQRGTEPQETVEQFVTRHARHQITFAVQRAGASLKDVYDDLPPADRAQVDAILVRNRPTRRAPL